jgi:pimeloyl-ACP methyl ester carboxylesterase
MPHAATPLQLPRASLRLRVLGDGELPVLLLHGWMMSSGVWDDVVGRLDTGGLRFLLLDQRGAAGAVGRDGGHGLADLGGDLLDLLDALALDRVVVIGHSMGGQLALWLAAQRPDRVAAVCAVTPVPPAGLPLSPDAMAMFGAVGGDAGAARRVLQLATVGASPTTLEPRGDLAMDVDPAAVAPMLQAWTGGVDVDLGAITTPTLVVATDDPFLSPAFLREALVERLPKGRLAVLPGPGHYPQVEGPDALAVVLNAFLETVPRHAPGA